MKSAAITPYLFFGGRCEEALEFYRKALGAVIGKITRYEDVKSRRRPPAGFEKRIMHAEFTVGGVPLIAADGFDAPPTFDGVILALTLPTEEEARRAFDALAEEGHIYVPLSRTTFSSCCGMLADRFDLGWMIMVPKIEAADDPVVKETTV